MPLNEINPASFANRSRVDSKGREWKFVQVDDFGGRWLQGRSWDHPWVIGKLKWVCSTCDGWVPVQFKSFVHDEVIVPDPIEQLDQHDCDLEYVRRVLES